MYVSMCSYALYRLPFEVRQVASTLAEEDITRQRIHEYLVAQKDLSAMDGLPSSGSLVDQTRLTYFSSPFHDTRSYGSTSASSTSSVMFQRAQKTNEYKKNYTK